MKYDVFIICPVRDVNTNTKNAIANYVSSLEADGMKVYWPYRDTDQTDQRGDRICADNREAMRQSNEVHIWYQPTSQGSVFDFGMAWSMGKPTTLINPAAVKPTSSKSFNNVILVATNNL